jgi:protein-tyrosine-phosphatase
MSDKKRVLILCTGNSARSQMAEGLLRHDAGDRFTVESAGTKPSTVRREAITVMKEVGIDITSHRSKHVAEFAGKDFDYVLTVCDNAKEVVRYSSAKLRGCITASTILPLRVRKKSGSGCFAPCATSCGPI